MAALTAEQLAKIRQKLSEWTNPDFEKQHVNAAVETINTLFDGVKVSWSASVDTATEALDPPYTFTNELKKIIFAYWLLERFAQEVE